MYELIRQQWHVVASQDLAERFHHHFEKAMAGSPYSEHVSHHSVDEIRNMKHIHLSPDNKSGYLVHDHGDGRVEATSLFNQSGEKGAGRKLLQHAIDHHGVNYVEAYGPKLPQLYNEVGFKSKEIHPFNREYASPGWDYERHGEPEYHHMHLEPDEDSS